MNFNFQDVNNDVSKDLSIVAQWLTKTINGCLLFFQYIHPVALGIFVHLEANTQSYAAQATTVPLGVKALFPVHGELISLLLELLQRLSVNHVRM